MAIALALAVGTLVTAQRAAAADLKPALTIAFAGYDQLISNLKALDELSPNAKLADKAKAALEAQTQGKGLAGLDKSRPWGVLVTLSENDQPVVQGYLPTTDLKKLLAALPLPGGEPSANDKGVFELPAGEKTIYAKQKGQWAVFSYGEDSLGSAPDDPLPALSDLTKKYTLSLRGSVQNIPAAARENAIKSLRGIVEFTLAMQPSNSEEQRAIMTANVKQIFDKLEKLSKEIDTLVLGVGLDASSKALFWDFEARGVDGSDLAKSFAALQDAKTDFGGFALPGAAMTLLSAHANSDAEVADSKATLPTYKAAADKVLDSNEELSKEKRELGKEVVNEVLGVLEKSVELKKSDCGMASSRRLAGGRLRRPHCRRHEAGRGLQEARQGAGRRGFQTGRVPQALQVRRRKIRRRRLPRRQASPGKRQSCRRVRRSRADRRGYQQSTCTWGSAKIPLP